MNKLLNKKKVFQLFLIVILLFLSANAKAQSNSGRERLLMNYNWKFSLGDYNDAKKFSFDDSQWRILNLPHDWSIEGKYDKDAPSGGSGGYLPGGIGWYRRNFILSDEDLNKIIWIEFDGVYMNSDVWLNGHHLGNHPYGYTSFYYDLTPYVQEGENIITVRVDNSKQPNSRWYSGSGIYRNVWLVKMNKAHIQHWGIQAAASNVSSDSALINVKTSIENNDDKLIEGKLISILTNKENNVVGRTETFFSLGAGGKSVLAQNILVVKPELWSITSPVLYKIHSILVEGEIQIDSLSINIGIRKIEFDVNKGFLLNDEKIKMKGVCLHHDGGCVGAAVPIQVWKRRLKLLKDMGCNAIRTSHNPPAPEFLDLCDEMGFLVMDEAFDEWKIGKRKFGYYQYFDKWGKSDLISMIRRDRNHPSIVLWSVGNEIPEQKSENGAEILRSLIEICHREDPTRLVTSGCDNIAADGGQTYIDFLEALDIVGYNYPDRWHERRELYYSIDRFNHPNWKIIGTECTSNSGGIRGEYFFMNDTSLLNQPNYNYSMINAEQLWKFEYLHDYVIGNFIWTGIDYLGEAFWPYKNWSFGVLDLCGFPKDGYYFYKSIWTEEPMIHIFPTWNCEQKGKIIPVLCYTNCDAVELFLNGKSFGEKRIEFPRQGHSGAWNKYDNPQVHPTTADLHLQWDIPYEPGVLKAVGKKNGKIVCTQEIHTAGKPAALKLSLDKDTITANALDVSNIKVEIIDDEGNIVPGADNKIYFSIEGEGKILGMDNGYPLDHTSYKPDSSNEKLGEKKAFHGLCLAVIQSTLKKSEIKLTVNSPGLKQAFLTIYSNGKGVLPFVK